MLKGGRRARALENIQMDSGLKAACQERMSWNAKLKTKEARKVTTNHNKNLRKTS